MSKLRVVLAGCGGISNAWMAGVKDLPDVEMVGFVDINREAAAARAQQYGWTNAAIGTDLEAVLKDTRPDVVFDCAVPEAHLPITLEALEQGCHVLGEKPLADSMEHARTMVTAAQGSGKLFAVMQNRRYDARIRRLKAYLTSGVVGPLTTLHCDFFIGAHFGGFRDHMQHVLLLDMAIHTFDAARFITGADPVSVYCKEWNPAGSWYDHDASAVAVYQMTNGLVYTYRGSWCSEGLHTTWESDWRVVGQQGSVRWDGADGFQAEVVTKTGGFMSDKAKIEVPPFDAGDKVGGHAGCIRDFVRCVQTVATPETIASDNIKSLAMVFGAIESARTGREVAV
jgi:predicted dehydrogenase